MAPSRSLVPATLMVLIGISGCGGSGTRTAAPAPVGAAATTAAGNGTGAPAASAAGKASASAAGNASASAAGNASASAAGKATRGSGGGSTKAGDGGVAYTPWGPDDPPVPEQYAALAASPGQLPRCDNVADADPGGAFWATVVAVCRAVTADGAWPATTAVPPAPPAHNAYQACLDKELTAMLKRSLRWHGDHPGQRPTMNYPQSSSRSPCQFHVYDVRVLDAADLNSGENQPADLPVAVTATGIDGNVSVTVDGQSAELSSDFDVPDPGDGLTTIVVLAARSAQPRTASIQVSSERGALAATAKLPGSVPSPSPDPDGTTPSPDPDGNTHEPPTTSPSEPASQPGSSASAPAS